MFEILIWCDAPDKGYRQPEGPDADRESEKDGIS